MILKQAKAAFGLTANVTATKTGSSGSLVLGKTAKTVNFTTAVKAYFLRAVFAGPGDLLNLVLRTNVTSASTAWVAGAAQVTTATAAGTVSAGGNASVVVTSAGMAGSPKTLAVAVATSDTPTLWAAKVRTALAADAAVAARFTVGGSTTAIVLTRKPTATFVVPSETGTLAIYAANDATLNVALATGTATGITAAATSAATTAGVVSDGVKVYGGGATDWEGNALGTLTTLQGVYLEAEADKLNVTGAAEVQAIAAGETVQRGAVAGVLAGETTLVITPAATSGAVDIMVVGI